MVSTEHLNVLQKICTALADNIVDWALTGSLGFAIQGVPVVVHDIDIQTNMAGAFEIERRFAAFVTKQVTFSATAYIQSFYGALEIDEVIVEIMGNLQKRVNNGEWEEPVDISRYKRIVAVGDMRVPVLSLRYERDAYHKLGRSDKVKLLEKWLGNHPDYL